MRTMGMSGLRVLRGSGGRARASSGHDWLWYVFVALAIVAVLAIVVGSLSSDKRAIEALPDDQRLAVYSRTFEDLRSFCGTGHPDALRDHCRELASFVARFPECRGECETLTRRLLVARPTR
jgi:hypothetical protein